MSEPTAPDAAPSPAAAPAAAPAPAPAPDPALLALREEVGRVLGAAATPDPASGVPAWRIDAAGVADAARRLRAAGFDYLLFVTAVDRPAEAKFEVTYLITRFDDGRQLALVADVPRESPEIDTVSGVWAGADWHERETFDMFGIVFRGHPFLRRILLDEDWPGHPLRKDYVDTLHDVVKRPY
jgi:NADH:ubiquinone oxidoreductase subunit C